MPGPFDRFRNLEDPRPERDGPPDPTPESVAERFGQPDIPPETSDVAPIHCPKCGAENQPRAASCFNCSESLETAQVRAHRVEEKAQFASEQRRAAVLRESRRKEAEAYAEREIARHRAQQVQSTGDATDSDESSVPVAWLWRATNRVQDPWLRLGLQLAIVFGIGALVFYGLAPERMGFLILVGILLGGGSYLGGYYGYGRYGRYRRWWR